MDRHQADRFLDRLGPGQFTAVAQLLEVLTAKPLFQALAQASVEEEEVTPDTAPLPCLPGAWRAHSA